MSREWAWRAMACWPLPPLPGARKIERPADRAWIDWVGAVARMAEGDYSGAWPVLHDLALSGGADSPDGEDAWPGPVGRPGEDSGGHVDDQARDDAGRDRCMDELAGLACATIASGLRQFGEHARAVPWDDRARRAVGQARWDGCIGRAADEVGRGDPAAAAGHLDASQQDRSLRGRLRRAWVGAELSLSQADDDAAGSFAAAALRRAAEYESPRHQMKTDLIVRVTRRAGGDPDPAPLRELARACDEAGLRSLVWPCAAALGSDLDADTAGRARRAIAFVEARRPVGVGLAWREQTIRILG